MTDLRTVPFRLPSPNELARIASEYFKHRISEGETVGVFRILQILGRQGNVSTVYNAEATVDVPRKKIKRGGRYIIKGIPFRPSTSSSTNSRNLKSFFNEIRILPFVSNPGANNIVRLLDANGTVARGKVYMAFEELAYQSVREKYTDKRLDPSIVLGFSRALTRALMHLHSLGIVHGDIKPDNFMLDLRGEAILVDFGSAFFSGKKGSSRKKGGQPPDPDEYREPFTPLYCPPELARYKLYGGMFNPKDEASDAWSLGVTLWELLVGERPFSWMKNESLNNILEEIGRGTLPVRGDVLNQMAKATPHKSVAEAYRFLSRLISRLLIVDPARRMSCFEAQGEILSFLGSGEGTKVAAKGLPTGVKDRLEIARKIARLDEPMTTQEKDSQRPRRRSTSALELKTLELREAYLKGGKRRSGIEKGLFTPPSEDPSPQPAPGSEPWDEGDIRPEPDVVSPPPEARRKKTEKRIPLSFEEFARKRKEEEIRRMKTSCDEGSATQGGGDTQAGSDTQASDLDETSVDMDPPAGLPEFPAPDGKDANDSDATRVDPLGPRRKRRRPITPFDPDATRDE